MKNTAFYNRDCTKNENTERSRTTTKDDDDDDIDYDIIPPGFEKIETTRLAMMNHR